jgi:hypothetical protein
VIYVLLSSAAGYCKDIMDFLAFNQALAQVNATLLLLSRDGL